MTRSSSTSPRAGTPTWRHNTRSTPWLASALLLAAVATPAWAQERVLRAPGTPPATQQGGNAAPAIAAATTPHAGKPTARYDMRASDILDKEVRNNQGQNLGNVIELIVDTRNQRVHFAVLSFGGVLDLGDKLFAYPIAAFRPSANGEYLILSMDKDRLRNAPGFDRDIWPDWLDKGFRGQVDRFFGPSMAPPYGPEPRLVRASKLIGKDVDDRTGRDAGEIEDLVIDMSNGQVRYAVVEFDEPWSLSEKLLPLPMSAFNIPSREMDDELIVNVAPDRLDAARGFDEDHWPDLNEPNWRRATDRYVDSLAPQR